MTPPCPKGAPCPNSYELPENPSRFPEPDRCMDQCEVSEGKDWFSHGRPSLPFSLNVPWADFHMAIISPHLKTIHKNPTPITAHIKVRDNHIPIHEQSLLHFNGLHFDFGLGSFHSLLHLSVDSSGQLNLAERRENGTIEIYPLLNSILASLVPKEFLNESERFPASYELNEFLGRVRLVLEEYKKEDAKFYFADERPPSPAQTWETLGKFFSPGSSLQVSLEHLHDFFIPGVLDLGPSSAQVKLNWEAGPQLRGSLDNFQIQLDPMGALEGAQIQSGVGRINDLGDWIPPGIQFLLVHPDKPVLFTANLDFEINVNFPQTGPLTLVGTLLSHTAVDLKNSSPALLPRKTSFQIKNLTVFSQENAQALISEVDLLVTDNPRYLDPLADPDDFLPEEAIFHFQINGILPQQKVASGTFQLLPGTTESYDRTPALQNTWNIELADLQLFPLPIPRTVKINLPLLPLGQVQPGRGIQMDNLTWNFQPLSTPDAWGFVLGVNADRLRLGKLDLKQPELNISLQGNPMSPGVWRYEIPVLELKANPKGSGRGMVRGKLKIQQKGRPIEFLWDDNTRRFSMKGLNLAIWAQGLRVLPKKFMQILDPRVKSLGLDGRLKGHFEGEIAPERKNWWGKGKIVLRGDSKGDVYWLDKRGRRVGPPLIRDTRWTWKRVRSLNRRGPYILGNFNLLTVLNPQALAPQELPNPNASSRTQAFGKTRSDLKPYEIEWEMKHDNQPWDAQGFKKRILHYLNRLCEQDPDCNSSGK